ncbi:hypothetical protein Q4610_14600 [Sphingobium sp. HBC34]|uniref:DUF3325 domain-containing protein n=1 Tax=Sphingobium cyanobacteriorum TaxID=3063954 RepID=A0ABT8ZS51_9SPHN|nr:hypothetical protein [Sphingobium sp. HBC34]MDO7836276.1 hypothetical protein [Sphingobium sp. HBC34]
MNTVLLLAAVLTFLLAAVHSILGERLIFRHLVSENRWTEGAIGLLSARRWAALRSSWHLVSILGGGLGLVLLVLATVLPINESKVVGATFLISALYWIVGTRGKHPGWIVMLIIAVLAFLA